LESFLSHRGVIVLSYFFDGERGHYFAFQPKPLNNSSNVKINISEYLGGSNLSSIEIEPNNNNDDDNSIIPYNNDISLYHTNVSEKELDIDTLSLDNFNNFDKVNNINNIPEKNKDIRFKLPSFSSEFPFKVYNNSIVIEDNDNVDNSIILKKKKKKLLYLNLCYLKFLKLIIIIIILKVKMIVIVL
jgi:hypothetical protein